MIILFSVLVIFSLFDIFFGKTLFKDDVIVPFQLFLRIVFYIGLILLLCLMRIFNGY